MILLASLLWPVLAASLILGAGIGWLTGPPRTGSARWSALALVAATTLSGGIALAGVVPDRPGLWLEGTTLVLAAYLAGATLLSGAVHLAGAARRSPGSQGRS